MVLVVEFTSISVAFWNHQHTPNQIPTFNLKQPDAKRRWIDIVLSGAEQQIPNGLAAMEGRRMIMQPILLLSCKKISLSTHGYMADWWLLHTRTEVLRSTTANLLWQFLSSLAIRRASSRQVYTKYVRSKRRGRPGGLFLSQSIPKHCFQLSVY